MLSDRPKHATVSSTIATRPKHPSTFMDRILFVRCATGDRRARDELIERWLPLAHSVARRYQCSDEPLEDLIQVASFALVKAVDRFDPARGNAFSSYAVPTIVGELKRHFRDHSWAVRPPRGLQELTLRVESTIPRLTTQLDRPPIVRELAAATNATQQEILEALQARGGRDALSLQAPQGGGHDPHAALQDMLGDRDGGYARAEMRAFLDDVMTGLPRRTREILRLRFEEDLTQGEIGELFGISQMQVSRIIRHAIGRLRELSDHHDQLLAQRTEKPNTPT
jgi:RNA polymerase sigma-B factor